MLRILSAKETPATVGAILLAGGAIERLLGRRGITVLSKVTGLMLAAMAAQLLCTGIRGLIPVAA